MKQSIQRLLGAPLLIAAAASVFAAGSPVAGKGRPWSPRDSIGVRYYSLDPRFPNMRFPDFRLVREESADDWLLFSHDRRYFAFVSHRGELPSDANLYTLEVFSTEIVRRHLAMRSIASELPVQPLRVLTARSFSSSDEEPGIKSPQWAQGGELLYLAMDRMGTMQIHRLEVPTGRIAVLTHHPTGVKEFITRGGTVFFQETAALPARTFQYPVEVARRRANTSLVIPAQPRERIYVVLDSQPPRLLQGRDFSRLGDLSISPDGQWVMVVDYPEFRLINLQAFHDSPVFTAPMRYPGSEFPGLITQRPQAIWSLDGKRVALLGTAAPGSETERSTPWVAEYDLESGKLRLIERCVVPGQLDADKASDLQYASSVEWLSSGELLVKHAKRGRFVPGTRYVLEEESWVVRDRSVKPELSPSSPLADLSVKLIQDMNTPPRVVVSRGSAQRTLTAPDRALGGVQRFAVEEIRWREPDGKQVAGGLLLPVVRQEPVSLVVQWVKYHPQYFLPDGAESGAEAAQSFAAQGFAVLMVEQIPGGAGESKDEGELVVARLDAAVGVLKARGLINENRIGMLGFSRTGYQTFYAMTHPSRTRLAATVIADSVASSYPEYLRSGVLGTPEELDRIFGLHAKGGFWKNKVAWLENETTFNVDRVRGAALFTRHGRSAEPYSEPSLEIIGAFRLNNKPMEYQYFPFASHQLQRPLEQLTMMQTAVDWMAYWLQDRENPDPGKADQNSRWRVLRDQYRSMIQKAED